MSCILSNIQLEKLAIKVFKDLNQAILAKTPFDLNTYIKSIYKQVEKNTQDANQAAAFAKLIPGLINKGQVIDDDIQNYVKSSISDIIEQSISFKKDIDNNALNTYLKLNEKTDIPPPNTVEKAVVLNAEYVKTESKTNIEDNTGFSANPYSFLSTTFGEVYSLERNHKDYNVPKPLAEFKSNGIKTILTALNTLGFNNNNGVNYPNVEGGLFFTAFSDLNNEIDYEKLTPDLKDFWDKKTNGKGKEGFAKNINGVEFIITNSDGEILYFDNEYNVVEKKDGLMLNIAIRGAFEKYDENGEIVDKGLAPINDMAKAYGLSIPEAIDFRAKEKEKVAKLREYLKANPQLKLTIPITGGSRGYIEFEFNKKNTVVSSIKNLEDFDLILDTNKGHLNIKHISTGKSFPTYKNKLSNEIIEKIAKFIGLPVIDITTKKTITVSAKNDIIKNYYSPQDVLIQNDNTVIINKKKINLSDVNIVELIKEALSDYYLVEKTEKQVENAKFIYEFDPKTTDNILGKKIKIKTEIGTNYYQVKQIEIGINKNSFETDSYTSIESINTEGTVPVVTLSVNSKYKSFISNFVRTELILNAQGKSLNLNPYISWNILEGTEVYQKLYDEADEYVVVPDNTELIVEKENEIKVLESELEELEEILKIDVKETPIKVITKVVKKVVTKKEKAAIAIELNIPVETVEEVIIKAVEEDFTKNGSKLPKGDSWLNRTIKKIKKYIYSLLIAGTIYGGYSFTNTYSTSDIESYVERGLVKYGLVEPVEVILPLDTAANIKPLPIVINKDSITNAQKIAYENNISKFEKINQDKSGIWSYRNQWLNKNSFTYIPGLNNKHVKENGKVVYKGVEGIAHHLIMLGKAGDLTAATSDKALEETTTKILNSTKNTDYIPVITRTNGKVQITYKTVSEVKETRKAGEFSPIRLRQTTVDDLDFNKGSKAEGFRSGIKAVTQKSTGKGFNSLVYKTKNAYGLFSGGSVVLLFKDAYDNLIVHEYSGSIDGIENEIKIVKKQFTLTDKDITLGVFDAGSYTGKVGAIDESVDSKRYHGYNPTDAAGSSLMIPVDRSTPQKGSLLPLFPLLLLLKKKKSEGEEITQEETDKVTERINLIKNKINTLNSEIKVLNNTENKETPYVEQFNILDAPVDVGIDVASSASAADIADSILNNKKFFSKSTVVKARDIKATKKQLIDAEKWYNERKSQLSRHLPFNTAFNMINAEDPNSVAVLDSHGVTLFYGSDFSDVYHEAWHGFTQYFLTKDEKKALYKESSNLLGSFVDFNGNTVLFKDAGDLQLEEHMGEGMREYVLSGGKKVLDRTPIRNKIFQRILAFLKALFSKVSYREALNDIRAVVTIKELYDNLYIGNLNLAAFNPQNVQFAILKKGMQAVDPTLRDSYTVSYKDSLEISESVDAIFSELINLSIKQSGTSAFTYNMMALPEGRKIGYQYVKAKFAERVAELKKELSENNQDLSAFHGFSGNALGADKTWAAKGKDFYLGKQTNYRPESLDNLELDAYKEAKDAYRTAARNLGRVFLDPNSENEKTAYAGRLMTRDYLQAQSADAVFAISDILFPGEFGKPTSNKKVYPNTTKKQVVDGGTGYAVEMAIMLNKPVYVFHQGTNKKHKTKVGWYKWDGAQFEKVDTPILTEKFAGVGTRVLNDAGTKAIDDVYKATLDSLSTTKTGNNRKEQALNKSINTLIFALKNFGNIEDLSANEEGVGVIGFHKLKSEFLTFEDKFEDAENSTDNERKLFSSPGNETSVKDETSSVIQYVLSSLRSNELNSLGFLKPLNSKFVYYRLTNTLKGNVGLPDIFARLEKEAVEYEPFAQLLLKLGKLDDLSNGAQSLQTAFLQSFQISESKLKQLTINTDTVDNDGMPLSENKITLSFGESNSVFKQVQNTWETQFKKRKDKYVIPTKEGNQLNLEKIIQDFPTDAFVKSNQRSFFKAIGINLTESNIIDEKLNSVDVNPSQFLKIIKALNDNEIIVTSINDIIGDNSDINKQFTGEQGNYKALANIEAEHSNRYSNHSQTNAENNLQYSIIRNSMMFQIVNGFNAALDFSDFVDLGGRFNGKFNHFSTIRNPYTRASSQINSIFNLDTGATRVGKRDKVNTMFLDNLSGVALTENDVNHILGQELSKLDKPSKLITAVHLLIGSYIKENPRHSDKSMSFAQYVNRLYSPYSESGNLYIATSNFADHENGSDKFANFMMKYLIAEHDKIRMIANAKANDPILGVKLYKLEKFAYFDGILSKDLKDLLYKIKGNPLENNGLLEYLGYIYQNGNLKVVENTDEQVALRNRIIDDIKIYFNKKTESLTTLYNKVGLFDPALLTKVRLEVFKEKNINLKDADIKSAILDSFVANDLIHNIEQTILFYGDIAQFRHYKKEFSKRISGAAGNGPICRDDVNFENFINSDNFGGRMLSKSKGVDYTYTSVLNTGVTKDLVIDSVSYDKILVRFKDSLEKKYAKNKTTEWLSKTKKEKAKIINADAVLRADGYLKMTVTDGQAYITLDIYRILSKGMDNWSPAQDRLYKKIVAGENIDILKITEFFPVRKFQYYGPAATNTLPITFFHKYSLFPLVPNVIKGTNLELVNDMMIAQKMDYLLYESASKLSVITNNGTPDILYNDKGNVNTDLIFTNNPIFVGYLKDQVKQSTSYKGKQRFSSQLRKIVTTGLYDNGVPTDYHVNETNNVKRRIDWDKETNKEQSRNYRLQKNFEDGLNDLMKYFELDILNDIDWKIVNGVPKGDMKNLLKLIEKEFRRLDYSEQDIDFIQLTKEGKIKNDFSISLQQGQIEKLLVALAEKKLIKQNVKGETLTQVANSMFEKIGFKRAMFKKATDAQIAEFGSNDLAYYDYTINPDGSFSNTSLAEIKIGLQGDFKKLLFHTHFDNKPIKTLKRLNECIINKKWLDTGDNRKMITITSVRIPLASLNFIEGLQVKEFLPENVGNIIILPDEIVTKSGTDFDVDKQMTLFPTIKKFGKTVSLIKIVSEDYVRSLYDMVNMLKVQKDTEEKAKKRKLTDEELSALIAIYGSKKIDDKFDENEIKTILSTFNFISFDKFFNDYNISATSNKLIQSIIDIIQIPENYTALLTPATNYIAEPISNRYKKEALENGTVTNFQKDIDGKQTQWYNDDGKLVDSISPTTALEIEFDLETHENNNIGQSVIGIGASVNAFSDILNKVGAYLNPFRGKISLEEYNILLQEREDGLFKKNDGKAYRLNSFRRQVIFPNHNYVTVDAQGNLIDTELKPLQSNGVYKAVSLSNLNDVNNENSISEVTSQLMNGWLDIAKKEWVLYVQGNKEIAPLLLMLNEAGLSFEDNVAFTSQPLIQEYIRLIRKIKSPFVALFGIKLDNPKYYRLKAREIILSNPKYGFNLPLEVVSGPGSPTKIYEEILKYTAGYEDSFNLDTFNANKVEYKGTDIEKAIFMHFLELEDTEKSISKIRMGSSMDTSTESSLFGVYNKDVIFNELAEENVFPVSILKKIQTDSQISSFFNREFIGKLYKDLYIFRNSKALNDYCATKAKKGEFYELIDLYGDLETAVNAFKDDIISFIFQNNLTTYDVNLKTYKGLTAIDAIEAKRMGSIVNVPAAILVSDNNPVLHFNLDLIKYQYESVSKLKFPTLKSYFNYALEKAFQQHVNTFSSYIDTNDYKDRLIAIRKANKRILNKVSETKLSTESILDSVDIENFKKIKKGYGQIPETFHPFATKFKYFNKKQTPEEVTFRSNENGKYDLTDQKTGEIYISNVDLTNGFAYEIKITEAIGETIEAYKERLNNLTYNDYLTNKALDNTFNIFKLFKHPTESFVDQFFNIKNQYENEFVKNYMIFDIFEASSSKTSRLKNLRLLDSKLTGDDLNNIHEELIQLANPKVIKVENEVENQIISDLFKRFTYYAFLQSGIGNKSRFGISKLALQPLFNRLMVKPLADFKMNSNILDNIFIRFKEISNDNEKSRFKNYLIGGVKKVEVDNAFKMYSPGILTYDTTKLSNITEGTDYINNALSSSDYKESDLVFIIDGATEIQGTTNQSLISNILSKPSTTQSSTSVGKKSDDLQEKIDKTGLEKEDYKIVLIGGKQSIVVTYNLPKVIKKGFVKFYSDYSYGVGLYERAGKKVIIPGFKDVELMMEQDTNKVFEVSTGLAMPTKTTTQKDILKELEILFKEKDVRTVIKNAKKINTNITESSQQQSTQSSTSVKEGVSELFKSNPELANQVYEALGFNNLLPSKLPYKVGKIYNTQQKEIFAGIVNGEVYINKELIDKYSNKEILENQAPQLNTILKNLGVYDKLVALPKEQFIKFLVAHEQAHLDFEKEGKTFKTEAIEEAYVNAKALIEIGILKLKTFDLSNTNEAAERLERYFPTKKQYIDDITELVAKKMDNVSVSLSTMTGYKVNMFKGSLWGKKLETSSMDGFYFLQGKDGYPKNKEELKEAISKDIARNIPQSIKEKYWEDILESLPDDEKALLSNWAYYNDYKRYTRQYGEPTFEFNEMPYPDLHKKGEKKYTNWTSFINGLFTAFDGPSRDLWFANPLLSDTEDSIINWYKNLTPEKLDEYISNLSRAMAFKSMVVASFAGGSNISALDSGARKIEDLQKAYYEIKQRTEISSTQIESKNEQITPQQKQKAQSKFQEYINATGKQDIEGFKQFVTQSSTSVEKGVTNLPNGAIVIKIPVKVNPGIKSSFTDATIDDNKNKIDEALKLIAEAKAENKTFVISNLGIGQGLIGIDSMTGKPVNEGGKGEDTFVYLSRELYKLGILNKNYVQRPEFEVVETNDEDLKEFLQMCLTGGIL